MLECINLKLDIVSLAVYILQCILNVWGFVPAVLLFDVLDLFEPKKAHIENWRLYNRFWARELRSEAIAWEGSTKGKICCMVCNVKMYPICSWNTKKYKKIVHIGKKIEQCHFREKVFEKLHTPHQSCKKEFADTF